MLTEPDPTTHPIAYAEIRRRNDLDRQSQQWPKRAAVFALIALLFGGSAPVISHEGPFISILFDVLPTLIAILAIRDGLWRLRLRSFAPRLFALAVIATATLAIAKVLISVITHWLDPYAWGSIIGL